MHVGLDSELDAVDSDAVDHVADLVDDFDQDVAVESYKIFSEIRINIECNSIIAHKLTLARNESALICH